MPSMSSLPQTCRVRLERSKTRTSSVKLEPNLDLQGFRLNSRGRSVGSGENCVAHQESPIITLSTAWKKGRYSVAASSNGSIPYDTSVDSASAPESWQKRVVP
jgi:hypothetical protein